MAKVSYNRTQEPFECGVSELKAVKSRGAECCEGLFMYEPIVLDFGDRTAQKTVILKSDTHALLIETQLQKVWVLGITDIGLMEGNKIQIKFESLIIL